MTVDLADLVTNLCTYQTRAQKDGPAWSPIIWEDDERESENAESACALVYDLDEHPLADLTRLGADL